VAKLTPNAGSVSGLTYLGSGGCVNSAIFAVNSSGAVWVAGSLEISPFPTASPFQIGIGNGFVSKLSPDFTQLLFSTFFDRVNGLALDSSGLATSPEPRPIFRKAPASQRSIPRLPPFHSTRCSLPAFHRKMTTVW
jgi:hypothetical protein